MTEVTETLIVITWEETPINPHGGVVRGHADHRHEVLIVDKENEKTYLVHCRDSTRISTIVSKFYEKLGSQRLASDALRSEHDSVFEFEGLTLGEFLDSGYNLRWKFVRVELDIVVNGRKKTVHQKELSYEEVVRLAFDTPSQDPNVLYKVTYRKGVAAHPEGVLVAGDKVRVKEGMIFVVTPTNQS